MKNEKYDNQISNIHRILELFLLMFEILICMYNSVNK